MDGHVLCSFCMLSFLVFSSKLKAFGLVFFKFFHTLYYSIYHPICPFEFAELVQNQSSSQSLVEVDLERRL